MTTALEIVSLLSRLRLPLSDEKRLQTAIAEAFDGASVVYEREVRLNAQDVIDFVVGTIGIEVKIKGAKRAIYHQVERYAKHESIKELILVSNVAMGFPPEVEGKPVYVVNLGRAWL